MQTEYPDNLHIVNLPFTFQSWINNLPQSRVLKENHPSWHVTSSTDTLWSPQQTPTTLPVLWDVPAREITNNAVKKSSLCQIRHLWMKVTSQTEKKPPLDRITHTDKQIFSIWHSLSVPIPTYTHMLKHIVAEPEKHKRDFPKWTTVKNECWM